MQNYNKSHEEGFLKNFISYINIFTTALIDEKVKCMGVEYQICAIWYDLIIMNYVG